MKKGYKKLLIFDTVIFLILILNSFVWNILDGYAMVFFLILLLIVFKYFFVWERDRHRYTKDIIFDIIILLLAFFLLYYLSGILFGFVKVGNYYNLKGIINVIIPVVITIVLKEFLRYQILNKSEESKFLIIVACIVFILFDISNMIYYGDFSSKYDIFIFISLTLLPAITTNITCSYLAYKVGYKPNIVYLLVTNLYRYLLPIVPNPNEYILSIINFLLPIILGYRTLTFFKHETDEDVDRNYKKRKITPLIVSTLIVIVLVYFTSGYFRYYAIVVASGSMENVISKGDIVIVKKINDKYSKLEEGQVIAYEYNGIIVVHRLVDIKKEKGDYYFYTKGDANAKQDNYVVEKDTIIGIVKFKIPFIGLPTVWLNEL